MTSLTHVIKRQLVVACRRTQVLSAPPPPGGVVCVVIGKATRAQGCNLGCSEGVSPLPRGPATGSLPGGGLHFLTPARRWALHLKTHAAHANAHTSPSLTPGVRYTFGSTPSLFCILIYLGHIITARCIMNFFSLHQDTQTYCLACNTCTAWHPREFQRLPGCVTGPLGCCTLAFLLQTTPQ